MYRERLNQPVKARTLRVLETETVDNYSGNMTVNDHEPDPVSSASVSSIASNL